MLQRLKLLFIEGEIEKEEYRREAAPLRAQLAAATAPDQRTLDIQKAGSLLSDMPVLVAAASRVEQRALIHQIIDVAWIAADGIRAIRRPSGY